ncbi:hypothetical protein ABPG75_011838 [Micractinium tetrahymenae]
MKPVPAPTLSDEEAADALASGLYEADDAVDILEAANQVNLNERREGGREQPKVDADFFNRFDDDADESDMRPSA